MTPRHSDIIKSSIAYLASEYPAISHTFIFREIKELRKSGFIIKTASIRKPEMLDIMTDREKKESAGTLYIKNTPKLKVFGIHLKYLLNNPLKYFTMFRNTINFSRLGNFNLIKAIGYLAEAVILLDWMNKNKIDHIHVHFANPASTVAMIATGYGRITYSMSVHGPDIFYNVENNLLEEKIKRASMIRCIGYYCRSQLMRIVPYPYWNKFFIVRCGVDLSIFNPRDVPNNDIPHILCVGRLVSAKGQHILLDACAILKERGLKFRLNLIGDGPDRDSLETLSKNLGLSDSVTFTGALGQDKVIEYYDKADIFIIPSFAEGIPVVLMEAMSKQIPCITTFITGIPELIDDNEDGMLFAPSDVKSLADKMELLIKDKKLRHIIGVKASRKISDKYDLEKNCKQMANFFNKYLYHS